MNQMPRVGDYVRYRGGGVDSKWVGIVMCIKEGVHGYWGTQYNIEIEWKIGRDQTVNHVVTVTYQINSKTGRVNGAGLDVLQPATRLEYLIR